MAEINLTQTEADALIAMEKHRVNDERWDYPVLGGSISIPLISADRRENFILDMSRGKINLAKGTYQNRARQVVVLVRLDFGGQPHRNPTAPSCLSRGLRRQMGCTCSNERLPQYYGYMENT